jgi:hypothetical protein
VIRKIKSETVQYMQIMHALQKLSPLKGTVACVVFFTIPAYLGKNTRIRKYKNTVQHIFRVFWFSPNE